GDRPVPSRCPGAARLRREADARRPALTSRRRLPVRGRDGVGRHRRSHPGGGDDRWGTIRADFDGTHRQIEANFNAPEAVTRSCLYYAVRVATDPTIPANGGCYRPIDLIAPEGSIVNARPPAAVAAGNVETSQRIADVLLGALAQAAPTTVPAASQGTMNNVLIGNDDFAYYETVGGGQGARPYRDGQSGIHTGMTNTQNTPIEALHTHYPFRVVASTLRRGSGGDG